MPSKNEIAATLTRGEALRAGVIDANEAVEHVTTNSRKLYGFTRKMLPQGLPQEPKVYIYSVSDYGEIINLGPGFKLYQVQECPEGEEYGPPCIIDPLNFFEEAKVDVTEHTFHSGEHIADAILKIGPGMSPGYDRRKVGWFKSAHNPPLEEEVAKANGIYLAECKRLFNEGENFFRSNRLNEINETHRRAVKVIGERVDWDKPVRKMVGCVGCQERIPSGTLVHAVPYCGALQDSTTEGWASAIQMGLKKMTEAPPNVQKAVKRLFDELEKEVESEDEGTSTSPTV